MVAISSKEHMVQGEPAFARINKMGQTNMEIFNCTNHTMTIEKNSVFGTIVNLEQKEMNQSVNIIEEKKKNILDKVLFARNKDLDTVKQKYIAWLQNHHETMSNNSFDTGQSQTSAHNNQLRY